MTKEIAIKLANRGVRITHRLFHPHEWFRINNNTVVLEDNTTVSESQFWADRRHPMWNKGYSRYTGLIASDLRVGDKVKAVCPNSGNWETHTVCEFIEGFEDRVMLKIDKSELPTNSPLQRISDWASTEYKLHEIELV